MRAHRPAATLATAAIIATSFAACDDTIAYAAPCPQHIAIGGNTDTHSRNVPGAPRTSIRITYPADVFNRASRPIAERQIRNAAIGYARGDHGYTDAEVTHTPGHHTVPARVHVVPDTPIAWQPPTPRQVLEPIVTRIVPKHLPAPVAREISRLWKQHVR